MRSLGPHPAQRKPPPALGTVHPYLRKDRGHSATEGRLRGSGGRPGRLGTAHPPSCQSSAPTVTRLPRPGVRDRGKLRPNPTILRGQGRTSWKLLFFTCPEVTLTWTGPQGTCQPQPGQLSGTYSDLEFVPSKESWA